MVGQQENTAPGSIMGKYAFLKRGYIAPHVQLTRVFINVMYIYNWVHSQCIALLNIIILYPFIQLVDMFCLPYINYFIS